MKLSKQQQIREKAAKYVTRLYSGEMNAQEEVIIQKWCKANDDHQDEFNTMLEIWDASTDLQLETTSEQLRVTKNHWSIAIAASFCVGILGWILFSSQSNITAVPTVVIDPQQLFYETSIGEVSTVTLTDGSVVTLNTGTRLFVDFSGNNRLTKLEHGEAFFEIQKKPARPFVIDMGASQIKVLGTKFNVYKTGNQIKVAVLEGLVEVNQLGNSKDYLLEAGSIGTFSNNKQEVIRGKPEQVKSSQTWRKGIVKFDNQSLVTVVQELNRYRVRKIRIADQKAQKLMISGVFHLKDGNNILLSLETIFPIKVEYSFKEVVISHHNATN